MKRWRSWTRRSTRWKLLARLGEQKDRIERLYPIVGERAGGYRFVDPKVSQSTFEAVVFGKGLDDELSGQMFAAVRGADDRGYFMPLRPEVAEILQEGDTIRVGARTEKWVKPGNGTSELEAAASLTRLG